MTQVRRGRADIGGMATNNDPPQPTATDRPPPCRVSLRELLLAKGRPALYDDLVPTDPMIVVPKR